MILEYYCTRGDVVKPSRANPSDAGLDVHFNPDDAEVSGAYLEPGESKLFSTGLKFGIPHGYMLEVKNRSGNASRRSLWLVPVLLILAITERSLSTSIMLEQKHSSSREG